MSAADSSVRTAARSGEALPQLIDHLAVESVVPAERDQAGYPALSRPARHRIRRHAQELRNLRAGQELAGLHGGPRLGFHGGKGTFGASCQKWDEWLNGVGSEHYARCGRLMKFSAECRDMCSENDLPFAWLSPPDANGS